MEVIKQQMKEIDHSINRTSWEKVSVDKNNPTSLNLLVLSQRKKLPPNVIFIRWGNNEEKKKKFEHFW